MPRTAQLFVVALFAILTKRRAVDAVIYSAPSQNLTLPLSQRDPAVFTCTGQGLHITWKIDGTKIISVSNYEKNNRDIEIHQVINDNRSLTITIEIDISLARNETQICCIVQHGEPNSTEVSQATYLIVAGPPETPCPKFHIVNATYIKVQWDKPFALPEFDVRNYTLTALNTTNETNAPTWTTKTFDASTIQDTDYPITHYISNDGNIPQNCIYINFTLTAANDAGNSGEGFVSGGFAIAPSPLTVDLIHHSITFSGDELVPMLHINFTFPTVCDYQEASYSVIVRDRNGPIVDQTNELTYDKEGSNLIEVDLTRGMQQNREYTAMLNITTVVESTTTNFSFDTRINIPSPLTSGIKFITNSPTDNKMTIIASVIAVGLLIILLALVTALLIAFIARRRKLKQRNSAHQREIETDEAVQRAAQAMVPNPIYSGSPVYEEIPDAKMLKSLKRKEREADALPHDQALVRDEGYVQISPEATVKMMSAFPVPEESKLIDDKYAKIPEDPYTVMNPAGTLSNQMRSPTGEASSMQAPQNVIGVLPDQHQGEVTTTNTSNGHCTGSVSHATFTNETEERYVMGSF